MDAVQFNFGAMAFQDPPEKLSENVNGLAGHALEMARGAGCRLELDWPRVPLLPGVRELAARGLERKR